jgi:Ca-activated chloride channel family protein
MRIGLQAKHVKLEHLPPNNLTFLIDVSGSMESADKLPLLKRAMRMLVDQMRGEDSVALVVYAGNAGVVLEPTSGSNKGAIIEAIDRLEAGGSTAGGEGIQLAYRVAKENFNSNGNNRVILATDGDFNVGVSSDGELEKLIESKRKDGIFLTVLGFGTGNVKDSKMELLADKGNGNYAYIDSEAEARKTLVTEMGGTLLTIAKDVKLQLEFNPASVQAYRLIGYENRLLRDQDFKDDTKDAGEIGAGHSVTALYEIVPPGRDMKAIDVDPLKYQQATLSEAAKGGELLTLKLRFKRPDQDVSRETSYVVRDSGATIETASDDVRFAAAVAELGMLLRKSEHIADANYDEVISLARKSVGRDEEHYRRDFLTLASKARELASQKIASAE